MNVADLKRAKLVLSADAARQLGFWARLHARFWLWRVNRKIIKELTREP